MVKNAADPFVEFGRGYHKKQFCEIILNLDQRFRRRCHLKNFLFRDFGGPSVW